jgi:hypothetical protein
VTADKVERRQRTTFREKLGFSLNFKFIYTSVTYAFDRKQFFYFLFAKQKRNITILLTLKQYKMQKSFIQLLLHYISKKITFNYCYVSKKITSNKKLFYWIDHSDQSS